MLKQSMLKNTPLTSYETAPNIPALTAIKNGASDKDRWHEDLLHIVKFSS